jgi:tetratricopeptide (TPR) repeat protein
MEKILYDPTDSRSVNPELSSPTSPSMKARQIPNKLGQFLIRLIQSPDIYATKLFAFLKICIFLLLLLGIIFILSKIYTEQGIVILPFEISKNENLSGIAIADQLTAELIRIQQIHNISFEEVVLTTGTGQFSSKFSAEQSLGNLEMLVPKAEVVEFSMADIGTIDTGPGSLSLGNIIIAFKNIYPGSKPVTTIRGSVQRYGSTIVLVAVLEGSKVQSWVVKQPVDNSNEEQLHEMIRNLAYMIAHDRSQSTISAKTWQGLKYYTEALDAYYQYKLSGNTDNLYLSSNYSLKAINSEKEYQKPFHLLSSLQSTYVLIGRQDESIEYCNKTIELSPTSTYSWINKGAVLLSQGKHDEAMVALEEAIRLDPKQATTWNSKGSALDSQGKYDEAIKAYDEAIRLDPNLASAWNNKGTALNNQGKYDEALVALEEAIRLDPNLASAWNNKGTALNNQGKYDEALVALEEAIRLDPNLVSAWNNKGSALNNQDKYDEAIKAYDEAIKAYDEAIRLDPKDASAWNNKGFALDRQGKYDEAIKAYDEAIRLDPKYASAWNNKGFALDRQGKYDEAIKAYDEAIRLDPKLASAWNNKGFALNNQGKYDEAIKAYDEVIRLDPKLAPAWYNKGSALNNQDKYDEAIKAYDEAIRLVSRQPSNVG